MAAERLSRRSFLKVLGLGAAGSLAACTPAGQSALMLTHTPEPSVTASATLAPSATAAPVATATVTPLPENTPTGTPTSTPTASATPTQAALNGDVLTAAQKERLARAALNYEANYEEDAIQVARGLGYLKNDGHPASVCGPLSIAILRDAGLLSRYTNLHDFWLLNPRPGENDGILERTFPPDQFLWFSTDESVAKFDFKTFPLKAGDFMYLYAGPGGNFEHMVTVSRVEEDGRAYAVTNLVTHWGYVIKEVLLVDPANPGEGQFAAWTDRTNYKLGLTGLGGFQLWRFQSPVIDPGSQELALADDIDQLLVEAGGSWRLLFKELDGGVVYSREARLRLHPASVIKTPIAMLLMKSLEQTGTPVDERRLQQGFGGRSYAQLLEAALVKSEEDAADILLQAIRQNKLDVRAVLKSWGAPNTDVSARRSNTWEIVHLFEGLASGRCISASATQIILDLMNTYSPNDELRFGALRHVLPAGYPLYNKRGTITTGPLIVADAAILQIPVSMGDKFYVAAMFAYQGEPATTYERLEAACEAVALRFWEYTRHI